MLPHNPFLCCRLYLEDKDGEWLIARLGEYEAKGNWTPELNRDDKTTFVRTEGLHGYGCICMYVQTDLNQKKILSVNNINTKKLIDCAADKRLKRPDFAKTAMVQINNEKQVKVEKIISDLDRANLSKDTQKKVFAQATKAFAKAYKKNSPNMEIWKLMILLVKKAEQDSNVKNFGQQLSARPHLTRLESSLRRSVIQLCVTHFLSNNVVGDLQPAGHIHRFDILTCTWN